MSNFEKIVLISKYYLNILYCTLEKLKISLLTLMYQIKVLYQIKPGWREGILLKIKLGVSNRCAEGKSH